MTPAADEVAVYERGAGLVIPEESVAAHLALADRSGAGLHFEEKAGDEGSWQAPATACGVGAATATYAAAQLVVCPGAWAPRAAGGPGRTILIERQVQYWVGHSGPGMSPVPARHLI